eukprot:754017-Rhodomonas_salina.1
MLQDTVADERKRLHARGARHHRAAAHRHRSPLSQAGLPPPLFLLPAPPGPGCHARSAWALRAVGRALHAWASSDIAKWPPKPAGDSYGVTATWV